VGCVVLTGLDVPFAVVMGVFVLGVVVGSGLMTATGTLFPGI
jgi:hypothetical protein